MSGQSFSFDTPDPYRFYRMTDWIEDPSTLTGVSLFTSPIGSGAPDRMLPLENLGQGAIWESRLGHISQVRSIIHGCEAVGIRYNLNPATREEIYPIAYCLNDNFNTILLEQLLSLKTERLITTVVAGPILTQNNIVRYGPLLDGLFVFSDLFNRADAKAIVLPAAPDFTFYQRQTPREATQEVLVYYKPERAPDDLPGIKEQVLATLERLQIPCATLRYGTYSHHTFRDLLERSAAMITLSGWETQGIAWAESWAMDVPTLMLDLYPDNQHPPEGPISAAPYLNAQCGRAWKTLQELERLLFQLRNQTLAVSPAAWVRDQLSYRRLGMTFGNALLALVYGEAEAAG